MTFTLTNLQQRTPNCSRRTYIWFQGQILHKRPSRAEPLIQLLNLAVCYSYTQSNYSNFSRREESMCIQRQQERQLLYSVGKKEKMSPSMPALSKIDNKMQSRLCFIAYIKMEHSMEQSLPKHVLSN